MGIPEADTLLLESMMSEELQLDHEEEKLQILQEGSDDEKQERH